MTSEEGIEFLQRQGWTKKSAEQAVNKYFAETKELKQAMPLEVHLKFLLSAIPESVYKVENNAVKR